METNHNGKYKVTYMKDDAYIGRAISLGYEWDGWMRQDIQLLYKPETDILDVGGNIGYNALMFSDYGPVYTFEPLYYSVIRTNVGQNELKSPVTVYPFGLGSKEETVKIYKPKPEPNTTLVNYGGSSMVPNSGHSEDYVEVTVKRLDDVYSGTCSVIKVDIEGYEEEFIKGATETINRCKPSVLMEVHDRERDKMFGIMSNLGYTHATPRPEKVYAFTM